MRSFNSKCHCIADCEKLPRPECRALPLNCHAGQELGSQVTRTENKTLVRIVIWNPLFFRSLRLLTLEGIYWTVAVSWRISWWPVDRRAWNTHSPHRRPSFLARHACRIQRCNFRNRGKHQKYVLWVFWLDDPTFCNWFICETIPPTQQVIIWFNKTLPFLITLPFKRKNWFTISKHNYVPWR